jgi:hypothetical protein
MALSNLNVQGMQHPRSLGVASIRAPWRKAIVGVETAGAATRNATPLRLGSATTFHQSLLTCVDANR